MCESNNKYEAQHLRGSVDIEIAAWRHAVSSNQKYLIIH